MAHKYPHPKDAYDALGKLDPSELAGQLWVAWQRLSGQLLEMEPSEKQGVSGMAADHLADALRLAHQSARLLEDMEWRTEHGVWPAKG